MGSRLPTSFEALSFSFLSLNALSKPRGQWLEIIQAKAAGEKAVLLSHCNAIPEIQADDNSAFVRVKKALQHQRANNSSQVQL